VLLTYASRPLGFVKNLGNRANNLLPDNRRIHMTLWVK
jgi:NOL1/NOP2/fmu family ribosome biogenesis protein